MPLIDALQILGNPNKEFYKREVVVLNYFNRGFDLVVDHKNSIVQKIILHTNSAEHPYFTFYDRCHFKINVKGSQIVGEEELKV